VRRAVAWGRLPLAAVLEELVETRSDLEGIYKLLGIELRK
jgi:hypothetical protein